MTRKPSRSFPRRFMEPPASNNSFLKLPPRVWSRMVNQPRSLAIFAFFFSFLFPRAAREMKCVESGPTVVNPTNVFGRLVRSPGFCVQILNRMNQRESSFSILIP